MLVNYEFDSGVSRITLNRPEKCNALSSQLLSELNDAVEKAREQTENRLTIIQAEGPVFCAGMDLREMQSRAESPEPSRLWRQDSIAYRDLIVDILSMEVPIIAAVRGPAIAGGMGVVLACDLVVANNRAAFGLPEPKRGIVAGMVMPLLLYRSGISAANRVLLSLETIDAEEARLLNLIHVLSDESNFDSRLQSLCDSILSGGPTALSTTKQFLNTLTREKLIASIEAGTEISAVARQSDEAREGLNAFLEKREPSWE